MNKTKIEYADYTWHPVVGCKHGCSYCYAERLNHRFEFIDDFTHPEFFMSKLQEPGQIRQPLLIFVVSMGDLFGHWIPKEWIYSVFDICRENPQHTFLFLTKNPDRYLDHSFILPENAIYGTSVSSVKDGWRLGSLNQLRGFRKLFVNIEPIQGPCNMYLVWANLVIVGAQTGPGAIIPRREWVDQIHNRNIFYNENIREYFPDLPIGNKEQLRHILNDR